MASWFCAIRFSVKLESPDSGNGHKKMYWFLLVDHASPLAFPRDTLSSKKNRKPFHHPPQPTVLPNLGAFISSNIPPEHHEWLHQNVLGALAETYMFQTGSQKKISSTENENDNKLLSFCPIPSSGELTSNLKNQSPKGENFEGGDPSPGILVWGAPSRHLWISSVSKHLDGQNQFWEG